MYAARCLALAALELCVLWTNVLKTVDATVAAALKRVMWVYVCWYVCVSTSNAN